MMRAVFLLSTMVVGLVACSDSTGPHEGSAIRVEHLVPLQGVGVRNTDFPDVPALKIIDVRSGKPVAGRSVVFTSEEPGGAGPAVTVVSDVDGVARLPRWRLGPEFGRYAMRAVTDGWGPVTFTVMVPGEVVAIYDLQAINGRSVPIDPYSFTELHYVLYESGVHNRFVNRPVTAFDHTEWTVGTYKLTGHDTIEFYMECWYVWGDWCIAGGARGKLRDNEMIFDDTGDFGPWVETYVRR